MNKFLNGLINETNYITTENGATARATTKSDLLDMFALGGSMRNRSESDIILMFRKAYTENPLYALRCLFYLRDCRGGVGERRFFRICIKDLAINKPEVIERNIENIPFFGRYDDLYALEGTPIEDKMFSFVKKQLALDVQCETPSLLAKWLKSENTSSKESRRLGKKTRIALGMSHKEYRKTLSILRERINIIERVMSEGRWNEIIYDKIPSKAGLIYKNAFAKHDYDRYKAFAESKETKVNASTLYPYEIVEKALHTDGSTTDRAIIEKYWENQIDVLNGKPCKMLCVCDTSGSMIGTPMNVAIGLSMYCAERIGGDFKNHYISFSSKPQLIKIEGVDFVDKVHRIYRTSLCENTNIEATFALLKSVALKSNPEDIPEMIVIISDMQIDSMTGNNYWSNSNGNQWTEETTATEMEKIRMDWEASGLKCPRLVYWNVDARNNTILDSGPDVSFVSGFSPMIFKQVLTGKTGLELMYETLNQQRYNIIQ